MPQPPPKNDDFSQINRQNHKAFEQKDSEMGKKIEKTGPKAINISLD
jgi:hypothetical protein